MPAAGDVLGPITVCVEATSPMHYAGSWNVIDHPQESMELVGMIEVDGKRQHQAVDAHPDGSAVGPLDPVIIEACSQ